MKSFVTAFLVFTVFLCVTGCTGNKRGETSGGDSLSKAGGYTFTRGYPDPATVQKAYDVADLNRAIQCYRFFYPTVSFIGTWKGNLTAGLIPNKVFGILAGTPEQLVFTPNSDTRYAGLPLDLKDGPIVIEVPPGPIMAVANDLNQLYVTDLGLPGPDKGKGGKYIFLPPGYKGEVPKGYYASTPTTNNLLVMLRAIPQSGGNEAAVALMKTVKVYPLNKPDQASPSWVDLNKPGLDFTALKWENNLQYWETLHEMINSEIPAGAYRAFYGELAELGIEKGKPFAPDVRMKKILEEAAVTGNAIMRVQSFADRRPDRMVWKDRNWEWAVLQSANGTFDTENFTDLYAREKWFYQAQIESPAMFNRSPGAGSLYWLGLKDSKGDYLDGGKNYKLTVPTPVPAKLFWSVTIYDNETRSEIATDQNYAALRSMFELKDMPAGSSIDLYFGPEAPAGKEKQWIKTSPGKGWFSYFRIYGPEAPAFDGSWKPGDFEQVN